MGSGKHRWKISFHRSLPKEKRQPPKEFVCPISESLMADPVVVSSGQTFERSCVQACINLGFIPTLSDGSKPDFSAVIPNIAIKSTILNWCGANDVARPKPPEFGSVEKLVRTLMQSEDKKPVDENSEGDERITTSDELLNGVAENPITSEDLLNGVAENPIVKFTYATTEVNRRPTHFYSSSEESVTMTKPSTPLTLKTRPSCCSSSSSSDTIADESINPNSPEEADIVVKLKSCQVFEQEEAVISLRKITRTKEEMRVPLCSPRLLAALRPLLISRYSGIQTNAVAALVNLSLEKMNKVKIVRAGIVPLLVDALKGGFPEAQEHAAGALFSLALNDENKMAIGVLGALPPLLHALRTGSERAQNDSALALYHLSLVQSNRSKLVKLGAVPTLLAMVKVRDLASRVLLILCNLASCTEGRAAMLDANAVECFVGMMRGNELDSGVTHENCVAALYALSQGSLRFRGLAKEAGVVEVLREVEDRGSERAREKAKKMLVMMRGRSVGEEEDELDLDESLDSGIMSLSPYRVGKNACGANST